MRAGEGNISIFESRKKWIKDRGGQLIEAVHCILLDKS